MVSAEFTEFYNKIGAIKSGPSQDEQLKLYAWAKIAQNAEIGQRPGMFDFVGKAKWDVWNMRLQEGLSPAGAEEKYIALAKELTAAHK